MKRIKERTILFDERYTLLTGKLLVAAPSITHSILGRALVYVIEHDNIGGAVGVNINHPFGSIKMGDFFSPDRKKNIDKDLQNTNLPIFFGGPVESEKVVVLSLNDAQQNYFDEHHKLSIHANAGDYLHNMLVGDLDEKFILARGVCMWEKGQLEAEIDENKWIVANPTVPLIFSTSIKDKWEFALQQTLGKKDISSMVSYSGEA